MAQTSSPQVSPLSLMQKTAHHYHTSKLNRKFWKVWKAFGSFRAKLKKYPIVGTEYIPLFFVVTINSRKWITCENILQIVWFSNQNHQIYFKIPPRLTNSGIWRESASGMIPMKRRIKSLSPNLKTASLASMVVTEYAGYKKTTRQIYRLITRWHIVRSSQSLRNYRSPIRI